MYIDKLNLYNKIQNQYFIKIENELYFYYFTIKLKI